MATIKRLHAVRVGDVVLTEEPILVRILRTMRYRQVGVKVHREIVVQAASAETRFKIIVERDGQRFSRDTQFVNVE